MHLVLLWDYLEIQIRKLYYSMNSEKKQYDPKNEISEIKKRYSKRKKNYNPLTPYIYMIQQEKERALIRWVHKESLEPVDNKKLLEVGCGSGQNLIQLIRLGFNPKFIVGNELMQERVISARVLLPSGVKIIEGNALDLDFGEGYFNIIFQSMVFSSILDDNFQFQLAKKMWEWAKVGGGILWYDFTFNNPKNNDVRGIKLNRVKELFPEGKVKTWKLTLAPPLARAVTKIHPSLYSVFNIFPFLRTHILCWIKKTN